MPGMPMTTMTRIVSTSLVLLTVAIDVISSCCCCCCCLLQDCIAGEHANFVRNDELRESWKLFDGLLTQVRAQHTAPTPHAVSASPHHARSALLRCVWLAHSPFCCVARLTQIKEEAPTPFIYKRGERGPEQADIKLGELGVMRTHNYEWQLQPAPGLTPR